MPACPRSAAAAGAKSLQSCPTLCDPIDPIVGAIAFSAYISYSLVTQ